MSRAEKAVAVFGNGCNCSQAVFTAFAEGFGVDRDVAMCVARGFGGGIGRHGQACGALTGAVAALGFAEMATPPAAEKGAREITYDRVKELFDRFRDRHGATSCRELIGIDLGTPEGQKLNADKGITRALCPAYVRSAVEIAEQVMKD